MDIAERIKEKRKQNGLNQEVLAELLGLSVMTIRRWEWGQQSPRVDEVKKLAEVLHTSVTYLMGLDDNPVPSPPAAPVVSSSEIPNSSPANGAEPVPIPKVETQTRDRGELYYKFFDGSEISLPATPEGYTLFERMVAQGRRIATEPPKYS